MPAPEIKNPVVMDIPSEPASLFLVRAVAEKLAQRLGFSRGDTFRVVLAVDEACANVIQHAYKGREQERIVLTFTVSAEGLEIQVRDFGPSSDPTTFKPRELSDIRPGGLGLHFIRSAMDSVGYETPEGGGMLLRMIKLRSGEAPKI